MKRLISALLFATFTLIHSAGYAQQSQSITLLGGNVLNGTLTGTMLGAATMGLNNSSDLTPLRIGVGSGILGGFAIALYDVVTLPSGQEFYISGVFNDGRNSSIIILLDTFYGAAGGAILGSAITLIGNTSIADGLRYGSGVGAWAGFGFGLLDTFVFAERNRDLMAQVFLNRSSLIEFESAGMNIGIVQPVIHEKMVISTNALYRKFEPSLNLISFSKSF